MQSNKNGGGEKVRPDAAQRYYELKSSAMDDLVNAKPGKSKTYSVEELGRYRKHLGIRIADWVKILLIKGWFAGAVCFFFFWGLGIYIASLIDMLFILGMALGFVNDLLVNNLIRFFEKTPGAHSAWMMFPQKRYISLVLNVLYAYVILFCVYTSYTGINGAAVALTGNAEQLALGV